MKTVGTNSEVAKAWTNGQEMRSNNGNFRSTGNNLYSYNMQIGRTLEDGTKQVLNVSGVHSYSMTTSQHVSDARWAKGYKDSSIESVAPVYTSKNGYMSWRVFPENNTISVVRATSQTWKTFAGATKALARWNKPEFYVIPCGGGYTLAYKQFISKTGHVVTSEQFYNE